MDEQTTITTYEAPELVELGEFNEDTLGVNGSFFDSTNNQFPS